MGSFGPIHRFSDDQNQMTAKPDHGKNPALMI
jgi:hypothetical protein